MTTFEIIALSTASVLFGIMLIPTALRLRSRENVVVHLLLYMSIGLITLLAILVPKLEIIPTFNDDLYHLISQGALLTLLITFGALTLGFLKKERATLLKYWIGGIIILGAWGVWTFNVANVRTLVPPQQSNLTALSIFGSGWLLGIVTALVAIAFDFRKPHPTQHLNRLRYWIITSSLLVVSGIVYFVSPTIFNWAGVTLLTIGSLLASYIVLSYHTPDLRLLIGRTVRYSAMMVILFTVYFFSLMLVLLTSRNSAYAPNAILVAIVLAILLANISRPLWRLATAFLTRIIFGKQQQDEKQVIRHYSRNISAALDMNRLGDTVINLMIETLGLEDGIVFANQRRGTGQTSFRPLSSIGLDDIELTTGDFSPTSPFISHLREGNKILSQYDINVLPAFRELDPAEKAWLDQLSVELFVAIMRDRDLIGLLAFGRQGRGATYYDEDRDLMVALADQAALAMDSARLFEQLAIINQEVGALTTQLAGLDQGKSDFLSIASHELRTPLTHIHGYSRMLLDLTEEELSDPSYVKTIIEGIAKGSERMKGVIDVMFDVTEADVGEMSLFAGPVDMEEVIDMAVRPFLPALDERRIAFGKTGLKELPTIEADGTRLVQAFENLVGNAIKYTPDGGVITIDSKFTMHENLDATIEILVIDTGIGIAPEHQERVFEKFFRVDDTDHHSTGKTKFKGAGPGLGLTLVKGIAEAHGGTVRVESLGYDEVNLPGSKFTFMIPTDQTQRQASSPEKQSQIETQHWRKSDFAAEDAVASEDEATVDNEEDGVDG